MSVIRVFLVLMTSKRLHPFSTTCLIERILSIFFFSTGASRFWCNFLELLPDGFQSESISIIYRKGTSIAVRVLEISNQSEEIFKFKD